MHCFVQDKIGIWNFGDVKCDWIEVHSIYATYMCVESWCILQLKIWLRGKGMLRKKRAGLKEAYPINIMKILHKWTKKRRKRQNKKYEKKVKYVHIVFLIFFCRYFANTSCLFFCSFSIIFYHELYITFLSTRL